VRPGDGTPLTERERSTLEHALGCYSTSGGGWRNYCCTTNGDALLETLVTRGLMLRGSTINGGRDRYYHVTASGKAAVGIDPDEVRP